MNENKRKARVIKYLEKFASFDNENKANQRGSTSEGQAKAMEKDVIDKLDLKKSDVVLDIGCGTGFLSRACSLYSQKVTSIDISPGLIKKAMFEAKGYNNIFFSQADAVNLPFDDNMFDKVLFYNVILYFPKNEFVKALSEMKRVCKQGGRILIGDIPDPRKKREFLVNYAKVKGKFLTYHLYIFTIKRLIKKHLPIFIGGYWYTPEEILLIADRLAMRGTILNQDLLLPCHFYRYDCLIQL